MDELEGWTGSQLLQRSTRRLSLTDAGQQCLDQCRFLLEIVDDIEPSSLSSRSAPRGVVKVTASVSFSQAVLTPLVSEFLQTCPEVTVEMIAEDRTVNLIESRADLAIRIFSGLEPGVIAKKIGTCHSVICATPSYLKNTADIKSVEDLERHNCLIHSYVSEEDWAFKKVGEEKSVIASGSFSCNETTVLLSAVLAGVGVAMLPVYLVHEQLRAGILAQVLGDWQVKDLGIYCVYTSKKNQLPAVRLLLEFLTESMPKITS